MTNLFEENSLCPMINPMSSMNTLLYSKSKYLSTTSNTKEPRIIDVPRNCVEKLFLSMDKDKDEKVSYDELVEYICKVDLHLVRPEMANDMFHEITKYRGIAHKEQLELPLTLDKIYLCCILCINL